MWGAEYRCARLARRRPRRHGAEHHGVAGTHRDAIHEQVDRYLHQCFMVGIYEPYIEVCRRLDELWPGDAATKSLLLNSGAEAIENAVKIARAATGRDAVVVFDRAFHGRAASTDIIEASAQAYINAVNAIASHKERGHVREVIGRPGAGA